MSCSDKISSKLGSMKTSRAVEAPSLWSAHASKQKPVRMYVQLLLAVLRLFRDVRCETSAAVVSPAC
eukprot:6195521-Pleurochrysis_carterae.AAC.4